MDGSRLRLVPITAENVKNVWPYIARFIEAACVKGPDNLDANALRVSCETKRHQLWVLISNNGPEAAAVTGVYDDGEVRRAEWIAFGGSGDVWTQFMAPIEQWAKDQGCKAFRSYGRPGMQKRMPREYRVKGIIFEKAL